MSPQRIYTNAIGGCAVGSQLVQGKKIGFCPVATTATWITAGAPLIHAPAYEGF